MKKMQIDEIKRVELGILSNIADFCDKNGLKYFLAYGTLIGAIRHKGFIPWDDDIDIWMPRDDYNKLIEIFNKDNNQKYKLISPNDIVARHTFVKIVDTYTCKIENGIEYKNGCLGVDIDIFPLDGEPDDDATYVKWYNKLQRCYKKIYYYVRTSSGQFKTKVKIFVIKSLSGGKKHLLKKANKLHNMYIYEDSNYIGTVESADNSIKNRYLKEWFADYILVDFEDYKFKIPIGYDEILTKMYGDYMQLPPEGKQITHHKNNMYWL